MVDNKNCKYLKYIHSLKFQIFQEMKLFMWKRSPVFFWLQLNDISFEAKLLYNRSSSHSRCVVRWSFSKTQFNNTRITAVVVSLICNRFLCDLKSQNVREGHLHGDL